MLNFSELANKIYGTKSIPSQGGQFDEGSPNFVGPIKENNAPIQGGSAVEGSSDFVGPVKESEYIDGWLVKDMGQIFQGKIKMPAPVYSQRQEGPPESVWPAA